ncbi:MAG: sigma-70 family RNA polymerase sigma factor [Phycisphaera sp. RhM]|nr:sigma-70 family RNA polymerase sigma factor [Phycisphaera sp. RhM]
MELHSQFPPNPNHIAAITAALLVPQIISPKGNLMPVASQPNVTSNTGPSSLDNAQTPSVQAKGGSVTRGIAVFASNGTIDERLMQYISEKLPLAIAIVNCETKQFISHEEVSQEVWVDMLQKHQTFAKNVSDRDHFRLLLFTTARARIVDFQRKQLAQKRRADKTISLDSLEAPPSVLCDILPQEQLITDECIEEANSYISSLCPEKTHVLTRAFHTDEKAKQIAEESPWQNANADKYRRWIREAKIELKQRLEKWH